MSAQNLSGQVTKNIIRGLFRYLFDWVVVIAGVDSSGNAVALSVNTGGTLATSSSPFVATPTDSQITVSSTGTTLVAANPAGHSASLYNNGLVSVWILIGGGAPTADTGAEGSPNGDGYGIRIYPGGFYETPFPITTAIMSTTLTTNSSVTAEIY